MTSSCNIPLSTEIENAVGPELADALRECGFMRSIEQTYNQLQLSPARRALREILFRYFVPALQQEYERGTLPDAAPHALGWLRCLASEPETILNYTEPGQHRLIEELKRAALRKYRRTLPLKVAALWALAGGSLQINAALVTLYRIPLNTKWPFTREKSIASKRFERDLAPYLRALGKTRKEQRRTAEALLRQLEGRHPTATDEVAGLEFSRELLGFLLATRLFEA